jgi:uncharacterized protein (TIGR02996 family)
MSTKESLLAQIVAEPGEDAPRLVFADWCEDNGDPERAEYIRAQVRLEAMPEWDPDRFDLEERSLDLLAEHKGEWLSHLPKWARQQRLGWRRGFAAEADLTQADALAHGDRLADLVPLESVRIVGQVNRGQELAELPLMLRLRKLDLLAASFTAHGSAFLAYLVGVGRLRALYGIGSELSRWQGLGRLTDFRFHGSHSGLGDFSAQSLFESKLLGAPVSLDLRGQPLGRGGLLPLLRCDRLGGLRRLSVQMSSDGLAPGAFAEGRWPQLEEFSLAPHYVYPEGAGGCAALLAAPWVANLRALGLVRLARADRALAKADTARLESLTLDECHLGPEGAALLAWLPLGGRLLRLRLSRCQLGVGGVEAIADAAPPRLARLHLAEEPWEPGSGTWPALLGGLPALRDLRVEGCRLGREGAAALAASPDGGRLRCLALTGGAVGSNDVHRLSRSPHLRPARLDLSDARLHDVGLTILLAVTWLPSVRELVLRSNGISSAGVGLIARCADLSRLRVLDLSDNPGGGPAGAVALADSPHLGRLLRLRLSAAVTGAARQRLRERFGGALELE